MAANSTPLQVPRRQNNISRKRPRRCDHDDEEDSSSSSSSSSSLSWSSMMRRASTIKEYQSSATSTPTLISTTTSTLDNGGSARSFVITPADDHNRGHGNDNDYFNNYKIGICNWDGEDKEQELSKQTSIRSFFSSTTRTTTSVRSLNQTQQQQPKPSKPNDNDNHENSMSKNASTMTTNESNTKMAKGQTVVPLAPIFASSSSKSKSNNNDYDKRIVAIPTATAAPNATAVETKLSSDTPKPPKKMTQVFLDCGQSTWGQVLCKHCQMLYVPGVIEDTKVHQQMCRPIRDGVPWRVITSNSQKNKHNITSIASKSTTNNSNNKIEKWISKDTYIVRIPPNTKCLSSSFLRLIEIVTNELGMDPNDILFEKQQYTPKLLKTTRDTARTVDDRYNSSSFCKYGIGYMYIANGRVLGLVLVEPLSSSSSSTTISRSSQPSKDGKNTNDHRRAACLGIAVLWVHSKARCQGVATQLVDIARHRSIFGYVPTKQQIAFSSPTQAGFNFATKYCNTSAPYIYCFK